MNDAPILPDDEPAPIPSERTMRGATGPRRARPEPGCDLLGRYTVLEELGQGAMGVVYKCLDREGGIEVAIKCLPPEVTRDRDELDEIRENYQIVAKLHHSAISGLRYLERDPESGDYYVVMDLAEGEDLSRVLRRRRGKPMPLADALDILRPIAAALDYAHGEGVLHRDVKPANVKVRPPAVPGDPPRVQLLDFGLAAQVRSSMSRVSLRGHAGTSGTPGYMAPEQWDARRQTGATDQYALGVMAYEMLAGAQPFASDDIDLLSVAVRSREPDPVEGLDATANAALLRALAKDPKARFPSCAAFVAALGGGAEPFAQSRSGGAAFGSHAENAEGAAPGGASRPGEPQSQAALEADVLRRKVALVRVLAGISAEDRAHALFGPLAKEAETELTATEEAFKWNRFAAAAACLDRADAALARLDQARQQENERIRREKEEAERLAREAERARREYEEAERLRAAREEEVCRNQELRELEVRRKRTRRALGATVLAVVAGIGILIWGASQDSTPPSRTVVPLTTQPAVSMESSVGYSVQTESHAAGDLRLVIIDGMSIPFRWCPPGSFTMGSDNGGSDERPTLRVTVPNGFWMGEKEVTQELWRKVMGDKIKPYNDKGGSYPMENISWEDCMQFVKKLNERAAVKSYGLRFAIPTEAQWEYACRAGTTGDYGGTGGLDEMGWYDRNSGGATHPVKGKQPNAWGLYDMHGNVWEWCANVYRNQPDGSLDNDAAVRPWSYYRVFRGGGYSCGARRCRSAYRGWGYPFDRSRYGGLRLLAFQDGN